jgi:hypothetical protein
VTPGYLGDLNECPTDGLVVSQAEGESAINHQISQCITNSTLSFTGAALTWCEELLLWCGHDLILAFVFAVFVAIFP